MDRFVVKLLFVSGIFLSVFICIMSLADGYTDAFYLRFTTPKQNNLIIGTSRASQGIQPRVFDSLLNKTIYNFAFTIAHSPYGPTYYDKIKKKLKKGTKNGMFIVAVDPWSISSRTQDPNDYNNFKELKLCLGNTFSANINPNIEYLVKNFDGQYLSLLTQNKSDYYLHDNGWLEVSVEMDSSASKLRLNKTIKRYNKNLNIYKFSSYRLQYLEKMIEFLKQHGKVYLVRLPMHNEIMLIEEKLMPDFNKKINAVVQRADAYYDFTNKNSEFMYTDGNHLFKDSGKLISEQIAILIDK